MEFRGVPGTEVRSILDSNYSRRKGVRFWEYWMDGFGAGKADGDRIDGWVGAERYV